MVYMYVQRNDRPQGYWCTLAFWKGCFRQNHDFNCFRFKLPSTIILIHTFKDYFAFNFYNKIKLITKSF